MQSSPAAGLLRAVQSFPKRPVGFGAAVFPQKAARLTDSMDATKQTDIGGVALGYFLSFCADLKSANFVKCKDCKGFLRFPCIFFGFLEIRLMFMKNFAHFFFVRSAQNGIN